MVDAIQQVDPSAGEEIIDMLMTLSSKERSLCIFNPDYLTSKIGQARDALNIFADEDEPPKSLKPASRPFEVKEDDSSAEAFYLKISKLSIFEQKQKLGDKLYPLVKVTYWSGTCNNVPGIIHMLNNTRFVLGNWSQTGP